MKYLWGRLFISGFLFCMFVFGASAAESNILMLYWRGKTKCSEGFKEGLKDLKIKYTEFDAKMSEDALNSYLDSQGSMKFDLVYAFGSTVTKIASRKMKDTPILSGIVADPVAAGLIESWRYSGNNITAVSHLTEFSDQVDFISKLGKIKKVAMLYNPSESNSTAAIPILGKLFQARSIEFPTFAVNTPDKMVKAIDIMKQIKVDMVYLPSDSYVIANADKIVSRLTESGIPSYGAVKPLIIKGAMIGIVSDYFQVGQALAAKAKKILAGSKPSNIPSFRLPLKDQLIMFNPKTLESLKFKFPEEIRKKAVLAGR